MENGGNIRIKVPHDVRMAVYKRDGNACLLCGSKESLTLDHIKPVKIGGTNDIGNLQTLCFDCNQEKRAKSGHGHDHRRNKTDRAIRDLNRIFGNTFQKIKHYRRQYKKKK